MVSTRSQILKRPRAWWQIRGAGIGTASAEVSQGHAQPAAVVVALLLAAFGALPARAQTVVWSEDFESPAALTNWTATNSTWEIGRPTSGPGAAHGGQRCAATVLGGNYADNTSSQLVSVPIPVPPAGQNPRLRFWHWWSFSAGDDYGLVQIKVGTDAWQDLSPRYYTTSSGIWTRPQMDLKPYAGQTVQLGFYFHSQEDGWSGPDVSSGWYVDDLQIETGVVAFGFPENFEGGWGGWTTDFGVWEIGTPTSGPQPDGQGNRAHEGNGCLATVLSGNYTDDRSSRVTSPTFVVPDAEQNPRLRFWHWWSFSAGGDHGEVQVRVGATPWTALSGQYWGNSSGRWSRAWLDLTPYAGQTLQLGFYFESHEDGWSGADVAEGWYVDELTIETGALMPTSSPEGFENGWNGWLAEYIGSTATDFGIWEIGAPTSGPGVAHSGASCAATVLGGELPG